MSDSNHPEIPDFETLAADPEIAPLLNFEPVVRKVKRPDGWTAELQRELIARIASTGTLQAAVWQMGKHATGAEALYKAPSAGSFRTSWDAAILIGRRRNGLDSRPPFTGEVPGISRRISSPAFAGEGDRAKLGGGAPSSEPLPVICDKCRAEGAAGDDAFAEIPDILAFDPVPRRAHDRLWPADVQRAFIAALAVSGSPVRAARSVSRHAFGAEKLRKARGSRSFCEAWEAALDLARERELTRLHGSLEQLSSTEARRQSGGLSSTGSDASGGREEDEQEHDEAAIEEVRERIFQKLQRMRRKMLREEIIPDAERRAAWVVLNGRAEIDQIEGESTESEATDGEGESDDEKPHQP